MFPQLIPLMLLVNSINRIIRRRQIRIGSDKIIKNKITIFGFNQKWLLIVIFLFCIAISIVVAINLFGSEDDKTFGFLIGYLFVDISVTILYKLNREDIDGKMWFGYQLNHLATIIATLSCSCLLLIVLVLSNLNEMTAYLLLTDLIFIPIIGLALYLIILELSGNFDYYCRIECDNLIISKFINIFQDKKEIVIPIKKIHSMSYEKLNEFIFIPRKGVLIKWNKSDEVNIFVSNPLLFVDTLKKIKELSVED